MGVLYYYIVDLVHLTDLTIYIQGTEETATGRLSWLAVLEPESVLAQE